MKRKIAVGIVIAGLFALIASAAYAGNQQIREFTLFGGSDVDSTEQASPWIPVRGASRIVIKTWGTMSAFSATGADTSYVDSLQSFKVLFSDSVAFIARDSSGTIVTVASSTVSLNTRTAGEPEPFPMCADSVELDWPAVSAVQYDSTFKSFRVDWPPVNRQLRAPANGSGIYTTISPIITNGVIADENGNINSEYMRIRFTPLRRKTPGTSEESTGCCRANGTKGLKMKAYVIFNNR
jgi:hypothetical protein